MVTMGQSEGSSTLILKTTIQVNWTPHLNHISSNVVLNSPHICHNNISPSSVTLQFVMLYLKRKLSSTIHLHRCCHSIHLHRCCHCFNGTGRLTTFVRNTFDRRSRSKFSSNHQLWHYCWVMRWRPRNYPY
jgi:hypothetical protein